MTAIEHGSYVRIVRGPLHRSDEVREGVVDATREYPSGVCHRIINPVTKQNFGWLHENELRVVPRPEYEPKVVGEPRQAMLDMMVRRT